MLIPIGDASISFTWEIPSAETFFTCSGNVSPFSAASSPGIRLSSTIVVLPEPDTPVTTVSLPFGISTSRGFTVWIALVERWITPRSNIFSACVCSRTGKFVFCAKNGPIMEAGFLVISGIVPSAITYPPPFPASGPISTIQSASDRICVS